MNKEAFESGEGWTTGYISIKGEIEHHSIL